RAPKNPGNVFGSPKIRRKIGVRMAQSLTYRERQKSGHHTIHLLTYPTRQFPRRYTRSYIGITATMADSCAKPQRIRQPDFVGEPQTLNLLPYPTRQKYVDTPSTTHGWRFLTFVEREQRSYAKLLRSAQSSSTRSCDNVL